MSSCEMCGKDTELLVTEIEGVDLKVCSSCAAYGRVKKRAISTAPHFVKTVVRENSELRVVSDYAALLRLARDSRKLTQEEFAKILQERASVVAKWEMGSLVPNVDIARRIGRLLNLALVIQDDIIVTPSLEKNKPDELTLGDFIKVRNRK